MPGGPPLRRDYCILDEQSSAVPTMLQAQLTADMGVHVHLSDALAEKVQMHAGCLNGPRRSALHSWTNECLPHYSKY